MLDKILENLFITIFGIMLIAVIIAAIAIPLVYLDKKDAIHCFFDPNMMLCVELNEMNKKGKVDDKIKSSN